MYCSSCGKSISDESNFCMYCGKAVSDSAKNQARSLPNTPPTYIKHIFAWSDGPTKPETLFGGPAKRGFAVAVILADASGKSTTYDGKVRIRLEAISLRPLWDQTLDVKQSDFSESTFSGFSSTDLTDIAYVYRHLEPIVIAGPRSVEVWFQPTTGKKMYAHKDFNFSA